MESHPALTPAFLKKLGIKEEDQVSILNQWVPDFPPIFQSLISKVEPTWVLIPVSHQQHLQEAIDQMAETLKKVRVFWIAHPKKSSKIASDLGRDESWILMEEYGFIPNFSVAIDEKWSGLRFKFDPDKPKWISEYTMKRKDPSARPEIIPPTELENAWKSFPEAQSFYQSLSYTCRKEYVQYVSEAKKEETRLKRAEIVLESLLQKRKNRI
jgi:hypothetical protein